MSSNKLILAGYAGDSVLPQVTAEDARKLTHLNVAFGHVKNDRIAIEHLQNLAQLQVLKFYNPELLILLSVGGWSAGGFSEAASTAEGRRQFAESAVLVLEAAPFDGIDLDWEYPCYSEAGIASSPNDKQNFTLLLKELREALDAKGQADGKHYLLTIAAGADQYYIDGTEMDVIHPYLDFIQLMTYDMRGGFLPNLDWSSHKFIYFDRRLVSHQRRCIRTAVHVRRGSAREDRYRSCLLFKNVEGCSEYE